MHHNTIMKLKPKALSSERDTGFLIHSNFECGYGVFKKGSQNQKPVKVWSMITNSIYDNQFLQLYNLSYLCTIHLLLTTSSKYYRAEHIVSASIVKYMSLCRASFLCNNMHSRVWLCCYMMMMIDKQLAGWYCIDMVS